jgi:hypothetical protein
MAKKLKQLNLRQIRTDMLKNCDTWLSRFEHISVNLSVGAAVTSVLQKKRNQSAAGTQLLNVQPLLTHENDVMILIQAALVQEWSIFLDSIFFAAVLHFLEISDIEKLPKERLDLKKIVPTRFSNLRKSIATAASESFSFRPYDHKIETLCKVFKVTAETPFKSVLKKHVEIRNIFQHSRGKVRQTDLDKVGATGFEILQEDQTKKNYGVGNTIILTMCEILDLRKAINDYSRNFEVLQ